MQKVIRNHIPSMMDIFNKYATNTKTTYECSGCNKKTHHLLIFSASNRDMACFCSGCIQRMSKDNKEFLFTKYNRLPRNRKKCELCHVRSHNVIYLGKFKKKCLCHNCWGFDVKKTKNI